MRGGGAAIPGGGAIAARGSGRHMQQGGVEQHHCERALMRGAGEAEMGAVKFDRFIGL